MNITKYHIFLLLKIEPIQTLRIHRIFRVKFGDLVVHNKNKTIQNVQHFAEQKAFVFEMASFGYAISNAFHISLIV